MLSLSKPLDFFPIYETKIPTELIKISSESLFQTNLKILKEFFNEYDIIVIENEIRQINTIYSNTTDLISNFIFLPELSLYEKIFLLVSFVNTFSFDPKILYLPSNLKIFNFENFSNTIRKILKNEILFSQPLIFFTFTEGNFKFLIEKTEFTEVINGIEVNTAKDLKFYPFFKDNEQKPPGYSECFFLHSSKLKEIFCAEKEISEIYFLCEYAWLNKKEWKKIIPLVKQLDIKKLIFAENPLLIKIDTSVRFYESVRDLFDLIALNEDRNIIKGNISYSKVLDSILLNEDNIEIIISNQSHILLLAKNGIIKIDKI